MQQDQTLVLVGFFNGVVLNLQGMYALVISASVYLDPTVRCDWMAHLFWYRDVTRSA